MHPYLPLFQQALLYIIGSTTLATILVPFLTKILYKYNITRRSEYDFTLKGSRSEKAGTPIMGGLVVILAVTIITILFNWDRQFTYVPIGVMGISALLGAADDLLNIFGRKRKIRSLKHTLTLIKVHKNWYMRLWFTLTIPWVTFRNFTATFGSHPGKGIQVHEKLLLQFLAGAITAWWVYFKLGAQWHSLWIPFDGQINIGWFIIPLIIFFVMFTANAVNFADGLDGLAGGSLLITFSALTLISATQNLPQLTLLNATTVGALLTYTYFNIKPARFQMGDVGSLGLGALLAINAIALNRTLLIPLLGFIFYIEIFSVIGQVIARRLFGKRLFKMAPLHHHFEFKGWSEEKIVMRFWILQAFAAVVAVWISLYHK
jgi:phospho-N-acetylmuramoyl-pentapeptide-transferase